MYEDVVLQAIQSVQPKTFAKIGMMISFADVFEFCSLQGFDNRDIIEAELKKLDEDGDYTAVYSDGVLIGVKH